MLQERPEDVRAGAGVDVEDAAAGVARLAGEVEVGGVAGVGVADARTVTHRVELDSERVQQHVLDDGAGLGDERVDRLGVGGAVARPADVGGELRGRGLGDGDAALRPVGRGVLGFGRLRDDEHVGPLAGGGEGRGAAGDAGADDEYVGLHSSSMRSSATAASSFSSGATSTTLGSRPAASSSSTHVR
ncbi:hypothetical protein BN996_00839 [Haloferax massiliensis]|uniref:Uncharacterized protein n=1 Tax=Haloferax massiliensis TaxID=1476858 RepID=A0A0D6JP54_9EURY|nr:hypothetical protein BN996_00839 [Haloferax massiliensis]